ncbi:phage holin family protein [Amycolatopsis anabasis]|uniref:phage holin family protein n=1 Tax=Amycolatopsis anabasis TaxID=1840409 RepID=UPI00131B05DE|nr:phage holin family protein [Amycolatopsis anabasis]
MIEEAGRGSTATEERSVAQLVSDLSEQLNRLVRDEMRLAVLELRAKGKRIGLGAGLAGLAGVLALFGGGALVATLILALALVLPAWAAALIVGGGLLLLAGLLALIGGKQVRNATPPVPGEAVTGMREDVEVLKENVR